MSLSLLRPRCRAHALAVIALGESLGWSLAIVGAHLLVIGLLLASVAVLTAAQAEITEGVGSAAGGEEKCLHTDPGRGIET